MVNNHGFTNYPNVLYFQNLFTSFIFMKISLLRHNSKIECGSGVMETVEIFYLHSSIKVSISNHSPPLCSSFPPLSDLLIQPNLNLTPPQHELGVAHIMGWTTNPPMKLCVVVVVVEPSTAGNVPSQHK